IDAVLVGLVIHRIVRVVRAQSRATPGARLHQRFVALFSLAALTPAVVVALFMGVALTQGLGNWFNQRVQAVVDRGGALGHYMIDSMSASLADDAHSMANDLYTGAPGVADPRVFAAFLEQEAHAHYMAAGYIIDSQGRVLARYEGPHAPPYQIPDANTYREANSGEVADWLFERGALVRVLFKLDRYRDAYLYTTRPIDPMLLRSVRSFSDGIAGYSDARARQTKIRNVFALAYLSTALLVLLAAIWLGLDFASRIAGPIGDLSAAAQRVAAGDLSARVAPGRTRDEIDALGSAFNRMTAQLEAQR